MQPPTKKPQPQAQPSTSLQTKHASPKQSLKKKSESKPAPNKAIIAQPSYHLPSLDPEEAARGRQTYSLVLDLDETLIHYEEVHTSN